MYLSKHTHLLSFSIMVTALIRLGTAFAESSVRMILKRNILAPDMLDAVLWRFQLSCSVFKITTISIVFFIAWKKLFQIMKLMEDDYDEMGKLQKEVLGNHLSTLSAKSVSQLLQIWAVILIGVEFVYTVSTIVYRRFTNELLLLAISGARYGSPTTVARYGSFLSVYNLSHGFKYLEMLTAILLGFFMTGIFLNDKKLMILTAIIAGLFLIAFGVVQMQTVSFSGRQIGIVWTSVIFHLTETLGLFLFSLYLTHKYKGL